MKSVPSVAQAPDQPVSIVGHRVPDALSMSHAAVQTPDQPATIVGHRVPDALSMVRTPSSAQPVSDSGSVDATPWIILGAGLAGLGLAGGGMRVASRRGTTHLARRHAGV